MTIIATFSAIVYFVSLKQVKPFIVLRDGNKRHGYVESAARRTHCNNSNSVQFGLGRELPHSNDASFPDSGEIGAILKDS